MTVWGSSGQGCYCGVVNQLKNLSAADPSQQTDYFICSTIYITILVVEFSLQLPYSQSIKSACCDFITLCFILHYNVNFRIYIRNKTYNSIWYKKRTMK